MGERRGLRRRSLLGLALALPLVGATAGQAAPTAARFHHAPAEVLAGGDAVGVVLAADGLARLDATAPLATWLPDPTPAGVIVGPLQTLPAPTAAIGVSWAGEQPAGTEVLVEVRGQAEDGRLSPWEPVGTPGQVVRLPLTAAHMQARVTLVGGAAGSTPVLRSLALTPVVAAPATPLTASAAPTYRVYATRIGLIGNTTANGHVIQAPDRFVALPSRRSLSARNSRDYEVRIEFGGRAITFPVWDIGPWNVRDNYWDARVRRDMWSDLPSGQPQAAAAYFDAYHGGRDGWGRRVLSPAGIDLSDAAFAAMGLTKNDFVQVTFLWLNADA